MLSGALTYPYTIAKVAVTATASLVCTADTINASPESAGGKRQHFQLEDCFSCARFDNGRNGYHGFNASENEKAPASNQFFG